MTHTSRTDILINRIASVEENAGEFAEFESAAAGSPNEWERLARTLRDELQVRCALSDAVDQAGQAEIESAYKARYAASGFTFRAWSGWAVAAVLGLAWTLAIVLPDTTSYPMITVEERPVQFASLTTDEALDQYVRTGQSEGRVIRELPAKLVESYQTADGGLEVFYVRQFLEREEVGRVYEMAEDEHGRAVPVRVNPASLVSTSTSM